MIDESLDATRPVGAPTTWVLSNHDVDRHATRFAGPPGLGTQIRDGRRPRARPARARAATLLMLALPGSAYLYQGEELGLPEVTDLPDEVRQDPAFFRGAGQDGFRDGCRVPIPWTARGTLVRLRRRAAAGCPSPPTGRELTVEAQTGDPASTLELYRAALAPAARTPAWARATR